MKKFSLLPCRALLPGLLAATLLLGCASPAVQDYAAERPVFDLRSYFNGHLTAHGMFTDRSGRVVKRFVVKMEGRWQGDEGELDESFSYSDGSHQRRVWHLKRQADGGWQGRADDVVDTAEGAAGGNAFRWQYTLALPVDGRVINVHLDDWMYLIDERTVLNRSAMSKFGVHLGDITLSISKD